MGSLQLVSPSRFSPMTNNPCFRNLPQSQTKLEELLPIPSRGQISAAGGFSMAAEMGFPQPHDEHTTTHQLLPFSAGIDRRLAPTSGFGNESVHGDFSQTLGEHIDIYDLDFPIFNGSNPRMWIKQCNKFFELFPKIPDVQRIDLAVWNFEGKAFSWNLEEPIDDILANSWPQFCELVRTRFDMLNVSKDEDVLVVEVEFEEPRSSSACTFVIKPRFFEDFDLVDPMVIGNNMASTIVLAFGMNPYQQAISIIGNTLAVFGDDNLIPCFGFGGASTHDQDVFRFHPDGRFCHGFEEFLSIYQDVFSLELLIAAGFNPQERQTVVEAIVKDNKFPLSIILVRVGDSPWDPGDSIIVVLEKKMEMENLWDTVVMKMCSVLEGQISRMQTTNPLLLIKDYVSLLGVTLRRFRHPVDAPLDVLSKLMDKYHERLLSDCRKQVAEPLTADKFEQMYMSGNEEAEDDCNRNCEARRFSSTKMGDGGCKLDAKIELLLNVMGDRLLTGMLDGELLKVIYKSIGGVTPAMQLAATMAVFKRACGFFFRHVAQLSGTLSRIADWGQRQFALIIACTAAGETLSGMLKQKVDGFLTLIANVHWVTDEPPQCGNEYAPEEIILLEAFVSITQQILLMSDTDAIQLKSTLIESRKMLTLLLSTLPENLNLILRERSLSALKWVINNNILKFHVFTVLFFRRIQNEDFPALSGLKGGNVDYSMDMQQKEVTLRCFFTTYCLYLHVLVFAGRADAVFIALQEHAGYIDGADDVFVSAIQWWSNAMGEDNKVAAIMREAALFQLRHGKKNVTGESKTATIFVQLHSDLVTIGGATSAIVEANANRECLSSTVNKFGYFGSAQNCRKFPSCDPRGRGSSSGGGIVMAHVGVNDGDNGMKKKERASVGTGANLESKMQSLIEEIEMKWIWASKEYYGFGVGLIFSCWAILIKLSLTFLYVGLHFRFLLF